MNSTQIVNAEFLCTNNHAGYSSFDLKNGNTRKYHGLLIAGGVNFERNLLVAGTSEFIKIAGQETNISNNSYLGHPQSFGSKYIEYSYELPYPTQLFKVGNTKIYRRILMSESKNEVTVEYEIDTPEAGEFTSYPLLTYRQIDEIGLHTNLEQTSIVTKGNIQEVSLSNYPENFNLEITSDLQFTSGKLISKEHYYLSEAERGYEDHEDLIMIGSYRVAFKPGVTRRKIKFTVNTHNIVRKLINFGSKTLRSSHNYSIASDVSRFNSIYTAGDQSLKEFLIVNAREFIVNDGNRTSIIAGYHWFSDWGRDSFIAFKGILLALGRYDQAQSILTDWASYISAGLLPNIATGMNYNSIDAIHWFIQAIWEYFEHTGDYETILDILPRIERAIYAQSQGSRFGINVSAKGYLVWTDSAQALTWMDAKVDSKPVIDRSGAAIEIQALWYNSLKVIEQLAEICNRKLLNESLFSELGSRISENFVRDFWSEQHGFFADVIANDGQKDYSFRPNQLIAASLPFRLVSSDQARILIDNTQKQLLTKIGLKTLSPDNPDYMDSYSGNQPSRDVAYHQGTVWPWLLKPYFNALANNYSTVDSNRMITEILDQGWDHIQKYKLSSVPEIFEAESLEPRGAISQAWSVAALIEGIMLINRTHKSQ
jgi:predicted glycogen debranching enzyme